MINEQDRFIFSGKTELPESIGLINTLYETKQIKRNNKATTRLGSLFTILPCL